ncbi:MAG: type II toxin-antitoxin system RelE/ParE family toxin [Pseudomonadota bacterium]
MKSRFAPDAQLELLDAAHYYDDRQPGLGEQFLDEFGHAIDTLIHFPELGTPIDNTKRAYHLKRFPFRLIYAVRHDTLLVIAVAHTRHNPGYWKSRTKS